MQPQFITLHLTIMKYITLINQLLFLWLCYRLYLQNIMIILSLVIQNLPLVDHLKIFLVCISQHIMPQNQHIMLQNLLIMHQNQHIMQDHTSQITSIQLETMFLHMQQWLVIHSVLRLYSTWICLYTTWKNILIWLTWLIMDIMMFII